MMKKLIAWLLMLLTAAAALAEGASYADYLHYTVTQDGIVIHYVSGEHERFEIPQHIHGVPVVELADYCFADRQELKQLVIPASVTEISGLAFLNTSNVTFIVQPGSEAESYAIVFDYKYAYADSAPLKSVEAGDTFSVGLRSDGTVVTAGSAPDLSGWTDVVDVAAGSRIVGVKADGSVLVSDGAALGWTDVVCVEACGDNIVGLRRDGTVCSTLGLGADWTDVTQIAASADCIFGLRKDGSVVAAGAAEYALDGWPNVRQLAAGARHVAAVSVDTSVVAAGDNSRGQCDAQSWIDIVHLDARGDRTAAVRMDGAVLWAGEPADWLAEAAGWTDVAEVSVGSSHIIGLKKDGSAVAAGLAGDTSGKCDVGGWFGANAVMETPTAAPTAIPTAEPTEVPTSTPAPAMQPTLPPQSVIRERTGYVSALTDVNIRAGAGMEHPKVGMLRAGERAAKLIQERMDAQGRAWYSVLCGDVVGWVRSDLVRIEGDFVQQNGLTPRDEVSGSHDHGHVYNE